MSKIIYAVNSGCYSNYRIDALFSSEKLAKEFMQFVKDEGYGGYNKIEEFELDPPAADLLRRGYSIWRILMLRNGDVESIRRTDNEKYDVTSIGKPQIWERTKAPAYKEKGIPDILQGSVWAKTEKQAIKIMNEKELK